MGDLNKVIDKEIKVIMVSYFYWVDKDYGICLVCVINIDLK